MCFFKNSPSILTPSPRPPAISTTQDRIFSWPGTLQVDQAVQDLPRLPPWHHDYKCLLPFPVFVSSMGSRDQTEVPPAVYRLSYLPNPGVVSTTHKKSPLAKNAPTFTYGTSPGGPVTVLEQWSCSFCSTACIHYIH